MTGPFPQLGGRGIGFIPQQISGLMMYYDSRLCVATSGGNVTQWNDLSGNGFNLVPITGTLGPAYSIDSNNQPCLGSVSPVTASISLSTLLPTTLIPTDPVDVFCVINPTVTASYPSTFVYLMLMDNNSSTPTTSRDFFQGNATGNKLRVGAGGQSSFGSNLLLGTQVMEVVFSGGASYMALNGSNAPVTNILAASFPSNRMTLFNRPTVQDGAWAGLMYAFLVFNRQLAANEIQQLTRYFGQSFNITVP